MILPKEIAFGVELAVRQQVKEWFDELDKPLTQEVFEWLGPTPHLVLAEFVFGVYWQLEVTVKQTQSPEEIKFLENKNLVAIAVGAEILSRSSAIFDALQDKDDSSLLLAEVGSEVALNLANILLQLGQTILTKVCFSLGELGNELLTGLQRTIAQAFRGQLLELEHQKLSAIERLSTPALAIQEAELKTAQVFSYLAELTLATVKPELPPSLRASYKQFGFNYGLFLSFCDDVQDFLLLFSEKPSRDLTNRRPTLPFVYTYLELTPQTRSDWLAFWQSDLDEPNSFVKSACESGFWRTLAELGNYLLTLETMVGSSLLSTQSRVRLARLLQQGRQAFRLKI